MSRIARRVHQAGVYFVTTDTWQRRALFINTDLGRMVVEQIVDCRERGFYRLHAFALMPDHLHADAEAMQMIKGGSSRRLGQERRQTFPVWHSGFHDRWMRDWKEFQESKLYIERNPVVAKLVDRPEDYTLSSASGCYRLDLSAFE